jgi:hypothetical protein
VHYLFGLVLLVAGVYLLIFGSRLYSQPRVGEQISAWRALIPVLNEPPQRFYAQLYQSLKASLQERVAEGSTAGFNEGGTEGTSAPVQVVLTGMGFGPHRLFAAPHLFAERPLYLLVRYKHLRCYVYAGQTPTGLFVSSWGYSDFQTGPTGLISFTKKALNYFRKQTLFQYDAALMFTHCVHEIISDTVDGYLQQEGLKPLEALERRPIMHPFYQSPFHQNPLLPNLVNYPFSASSGARGTASHPAPLFNLERPDSPQGCDDPVPDDPVPDDPLSDDTVFESPVPPEDETKVEEIKRDETKVDEIRLDEMRLDETRLDVTSGELPREEITVEDLQADELRPEELKADELKPDEAAVGEAHGEPVAQLTEQASYSASWEASGEAEFPKDHWLDPEWRARFGLPPISFGANEGEDRESKLAEEQEPEGQELQDQEPEGQEPDERGQDQE